MALADCKAINEAHAALVNREKSILSLECRHVDGNSRLQRANAGAVSVVRVLSWS